MGVALGVSGELVLNGDRAGWELFLLKATTIFTYPQRINKRTC